MSQVTTTGYRLKKAGFLIGLFLTLFVGGFYLVNMDLRPQNSDSLQEVSLQKQEVDDSIKERLGSAEIGFVDFQRWVKIHKLSGDNIYDADPDGDGLPNYLEFVHFTDPNNSDTDSDGYSDMQEIKNGYDPDAPGDIKPLVEVSITKIAVNVPMVWSTSDDEKEMLKDLEEGISHYPKTASPGQAGNAVISGHSSNYIWAKGDYNHIFEKLNDLEKGDVIMVNVTQKNGRTIIYRYRVSDKFVSLADDERIFAESDEPVLTLSTCWPLRTTFKRMIVRAELVK